MILSIGLYSSVADCPNCDISPATFKSHAYGYVYSPMKAAHTHTHTKVYKIDREQNYTEKTAYK